MSEFYIREFIPQENKQDLETLVAAYQDIWNHPDHMQFLSYTELPFEEMQVREWFSSHTGMGVHYFAAVDERGNILGNAITRENPVQGYELGGLGVRPGSKRKGIGSRLVSYVVERAAELGYRAVDVVVFADNAPMLRLLLGLDFIPVRMEYHKRWDGGDVVHLKKYLY